MGRVSLRRDGLMPRVEGGYHASAIGSAPKPKKGGMD